MRIFTASLLACLLSFAVAPQVVAQQDAESSYFSQAMLLETIERRTGSLDQVPSVFYNYHVVPQGLNRLEARLDLYRTFGHPDVVKPLVWLLNRNNLENLTPGDSLVVPTQFGLDFRAYSPFPRYYPGARELPKLVILDKHVQAFGAYEYGALVRWGIINTGASSSRTPSGRFNINWKQDYRISSLSPAGEDWEMYWVMNIHEARGIHMHQYALPTGGPASHGCVRLLEPDAHWMYTWSDAWVTTSGRSGISSVGSRIQRQGTMVLVIGDDITGDPEPFVATSRYPIQKMVQLPNSPWDVPAGSPQQQTFDRQMGLR
ncbi:L,D-transpeptidase [soil metagenome]